jgi:hypothetical protein
LTNRLVSRVWFVSAIVGSPVSGDALERMSADPRQNVRNRPCEGRIQERTSWVGGSIPSQPIQRKARLVEALAPGDRVGAPEEVTRSRLQRKAAANNGVSAHHMGKLDGETQGVTTWMKLIVYRLWHIEWEWS